MSSKKSQNSIKETNNQDSYSSPTFKFHQNINKINNPNEKGETPIHLSILSNNLISLKELLLLGANPNISNNSGETPLHLCINNDNFNAFLFLLKYKAECNIQNKKGETPLHISIKKNKKKFVKTLLKNNADPNIKDLLYGQTPTHLAIINKLEEEILQLFKENKADIFYINDKFNKTPFDYAKDFNDEKYINLLIKIFENKINNSINYNAYQNNIIQSESMKKSYNNYQFINSDKNKYNIYIDNFQQKNMKDISVNNQINSEYYIITTETNKNEFRLENYDSNNEGQSSNHSLLKNKIISSDVSSENVQIKELNNSFENNSNNSKKVLGELLEEENNNKKNKDSNNNINKSKNTSSQLFSQKSSNSDFLKNHSYNNTSKNSNNNKNKKSNLIISHSNSSNNYSHKSNNSGSNSGSNIYLTNSVGVNKKIIKNIIRDTIKKTVVKSISSSDDNTSNINVITKEIEQTSQTNSNIEDIKSKKSKKSQISNNNDKNKISENNIDTNKIKENNEDKENNSLINNNKKIDNKNIANLYENGTSSFNLLKSKSINDIVNNDKISVSKLIKNETETINISRMYNELYTNTNKTEEINSIKNEDENKIINKYNNQIDKNKIIFDNINEKTISNLNNNIKENNFLETTNSNLFSELQIKTNNNNTSNNDISLNNSRNLFTEEDNLLKINKNIKEENNNKINYKNNLNENFDIKIIEPDEIYKKKYLKAPINTSNKKNKNNLERFITGTNLEKQKVINNYNISNKINDNYLKKKSNGNINNNLRLIKNELFEDENTINKNKYIIRNHNNSALDNDFDINENYSGDNSILKRRINKNNINNKCQLTLKHNKQLSYHLNYKINCNNIIEKEEKKTENKEIESIGFNNINNLNFINNKENTNPNFITLKNERIYKNKNNLIRAWHNKTPNKNIKSNIKSKNYNKISRNYKISKISLNKSGSYQNMNPPPIDAIINKDIFYNSNRSINSIKNQNNNVIHTIIDIKNNKLSNANTLLNNTTLSTKKPIHSSLKKFKNNLNNNLKNIPLNGINDNNKYNYKNQFFNSKILDDNYNYYESDESNNIMKKINKLKNISTNDLIRLREWLISCDLLCYYNLLLAKDMYHINSYINDLQEGIGSITFEDFEQIGIRKPGHIFRLLIKLQIDAGLIDNNLFNYINDRINYNSVSVSNTLAITSSSNEIFCCGINLCSNNDHYNKRRIRNNSIYFNDLSSFLKAHDLSKFKANFVHNGFDKLEFVIIQLFSKYAFNKNILNEYLHVYIDRDKVKLLNILYMVKSNIAKDFGIILNEKEKNKIIYPDNKDKIINIEYYPNIIRESYNEFKKENNIKKDNNNRKESNHFCCIF